MKQSDMFAKIKLNLQPEWPLRGFEFLRSRADQFDATLRELKYFQEIPFVFEHQGVGKKSLASWQPERGRTAGQQKSLFEKSLALFYLILNLGSSTLEFKEIKEVVEGLHNTQKDILTCIRDFYTKKSTNNELELKIKVVL